MPFQYLGMAIATLFCASWAVVMSILGLPRVAYRGVNGWSWALHMVGRIRYRIHGIDNVPAEGSYVIISNHCSHLDGPTLIRALPHPIYFVIKRELTKVPLWGLAAVKLGFIAVDRANSHKAREQMKAAVETISSGRRVLVFAEGTRTGTNRMLPFKKGGFHLAVDAQVPILPVAINCSRPLLPKGGATIHSGTIEIYVGEPIPTTGVRKDKVRELVERTREVITEMRRHDPDFEG